MEINFADLYPIIKEKIENGEEVEFTPHGKSMLPVIIGAKDKVIIKRIDSPLKKYDIVFYRRKNGAFVMHRIIKIENGAYNMCGDNQYSIEKGIKKEQIIAILSGIRHRGKEYSAENYPSKPYCFFLPLRRFIRHIYSAASYRIKKIIGK